MFQVLTGDAWSEAVARPVIFGEDGHWFWIYYVTFITINGGGEQPDEVVQEPEGDAQISRMERKVEKIEVECTARLDRLTELLAEVHEQLMPDGEAFASLADGNDKF